MRRSLLILILLSAAICLFTITSASSEEGRYVTTYAAPSEYKKVTGKEIRAFKEAPELARAVAEGKLPPLEQRLPEEPLVVEPLETIGQYGGTIRTAGTGISEAVHMPNAGQYGSLLWRKGGFGGPPAPYVAKSWEVSSDHKVFTFHLRKGMKWSDGAPFTADDIIFWYEDIIGNKELIPAFPLQFTSKGVPAKFEKVDDYTLKVTFAAPNTTFIDYIAGGSELYPWAPKHYLKQFHPKYTSKEQLEAEMKKGKFDNWWQLFASKNSWNMNPEFPTVRPWVLKTTPPEPVVHIRNPYYWKVDTEGNQLPYIDGFFVETVANNEIIQMRAMAGQLDRADRGVTLRNYPLLLRNQARGDYRITFARRQAGAEPSIYLNQTFVGDPKLRKLFQELKFRIALSLAIDRDEINEAYFAGLGKPRQASILPGYPFYDPEWEKAYAEYDPDRANKLLDEIGLNKRDRDGFRLYPDGSPIPVLVIESSPIFADWVQVSELVTKHWKKVGINATVKSETPSLYITRAGASEVMIGAWPMDWVTTVGILADPAKELLGVSAAQPWGILWGRWYTSGGKTGEEPPPLVKRIHELWDKAMATSNVSERDAYIREIVKIHKENIFAIGTVGEWPMPVVVKNSLKNVPSYNITEFYSPDQWFFKQD